MESKIISIATGKSQTYEKDDDSFQSAYKKDNFFNFIDVDQLGITGDVQVDKRYHGGVDKAIHIGSAKHFSKFKEQFKDDMDKLSIGANIIVENFDEDDVCIGDIYSVGDILLEVTQPRQPCWKIGVLFGKETSRFIIKNHAIGWYVRVLTEGTIDINDTMVLEKRVSDLTIKDLSIYIHEPPKDQKLIDKILSTSALAVSYKNNLIEKIEKNNNTKTV